MARPLTILSVVILTLGGCVAELAPVPELEVDLHRLEQQTERLSPGQQLRMDGVYQVHSGTAILGTVVSGRWVRNRWCLFAQHDVVLAEMAGGFAGDSILLTGFVRIVRSGSGHTADITISSVDGARALREGSAWDRLILNGATSSGEAIVLERIRDRFQPFAPFNVLAHRGGGRNSERLGVSENSLPMVMAASKLGATGVEIDVKRTRDGHIIVFHDETFSPRTVRGAYLLGRVDAFDLDQIQRYGSLVYGERIPTLDEMLRTIVDSTQLSLVWIDVKDAVSVPEVIRLQRMAMSHALAVGRSVTIALGIPDTDILAAYQQGIDGTPTPTISELDRDRTLQGAAATACIAWAPRWTRSITHDDIDRCHAAGLQVFTWTLDVRDYIADHLYVKGVDGILTNYPSLVAGMQDTRTTP